MSFEKVMMYRVVEICWDVNATDINYPPKRVDTLTDCHVAVV